MSVEVNLTIEGSEEFKTAMQKFDSAMQNHVQTQLEEWAADVKALAEQLAPVKTGHLRGSIYARVQGWAADVGAEATYASSVEFGTRHRQARPFLFPAVHEHLPRLEQIVCEAVDMAKTEAGLV